MTTAPGKICIRCNTDCSAKPRTKDAQGRYTCKACMEAAPRAAPQAKPPRPAAPAAEEPDSDAAMMAALMAESKPSLTESCPSCGSGLEAGAVVCTICGYNKQSGKTQKSIIGAGMGGGGKGGGAGSAALGVAASLGGAAAKKTGGLVFGAIGGVIGGAIGAAVWAGVSYATHYEIGWIAWGIGFLAGAGVSVCAGSQVGLLTGLMAAVIALGSVAAGKYATVSLVMDDVTNSLVSEINMDDEDAQRFMARQLIEQAEASGKRLKWPEGIGGLDDVEETSDYPPEIWADVTARWNRMSAAEQADYRTSVDASFKAEFRTAMDEYKSEGFMETIGLFDILWVVLAVGTAFTVGCQQAPTGKESN